MLFYFLPWRVFSSLNAESACRVAIVRTEMSNERLQRRFFGDVADWPVRFSDLRQPRPTDRELS
jgi:hypothetical protein